MKNRLLLTIVFVQTLSVAMAGNKERIGQAGANELLINPWARSNGMGGANTSYATGVESFNLNIAGLSAIQKTELTYSNVQLFSGSGISINSAGLAQRVGEEGVLGIGIQAMSFGQLEITTTNNPDGGQGTFTPQFFNFFIAYSRTFSKKIQGGGGLRIINESINNVGSNGVALDAGIRYVTGPNDRLKFGIALRNIGPKMKFQGDGLSQTVILQGSEFTINQRAEGFELPALMNIGVSYDIFFKDEPTDTSLAPYKLTLAGNFTSNSFSQDQIRFGAEFYFLTNFAVRAGIVREADGFKSLDNGRVNAFAGPSFGLSALIPIKKSRTGRGFRFDYAYQLANPLGGTHSLGLQLTL